MKIKKKERDNMKKINIVGVLVEGFNWALHPIANYKELQDYRRDYDKEILSFNKQLQDYGKKFSKLNTEKDNLENELEKVRTELGTSEKKLHEYTSTFPEDLHNYLDMQVKLEEWEKQGILKDDEIRSMKATIRSLENKVIYRNNAIESLRNTRKELKYQIGQLEIQLNDARNKVIALAKKVEFYEKQAKKTPKEKVDYLMKRGKKNENSKRDV